MLKTTNERQWYYYYRNSVANALSCTWRLARRMGRHRGHNRRLLRFPRSPVRDSFRRTNEGGIVRHRSFDEAIKAVPVKTAEEIIASPRETHLDIILPTREVRC